MTDKRLGKGIERNRLLLYVPNDRKVLLDELLEKLSEDKAPSLSAAIFEAIRQWLAYMSLTTKGFLPSFVPGLDLARSLDEIEAILLQAGIPKGKKRNELLQSIFLARALVAFERNLIQHDLMHKSDHPLWPDAREALTEMISNVGWKNARSVLKKLVAEAAWVEGVLGYVAVAEGIRQALNVKGEPKAGKAKSEAQIPSATPSFDELSQDEILQLLERTVGLSLFRNRIDLVESLSRTQQVLEVIKAALRSGAKETDEERLAKTGSPKGGSRNGKRKKKPKEK